MAAEKERVLEHLERYFTPIDNCERDTAWETDFLRRSKASLLLHGAIGGGKMQLLLLRGEPHSPGPVNIQAAWSVFRETITENNCVKETRSLFGVRVLKNSKSDLSQPYLVSMEFTKPSPVATLVYDGCTLAWEIDILRTHPTRIFDTCKEIGGRCSTPEKVLRVLESDSSPYSPPPAPGGGVRNFILERGEGENVSFEEGEELISKWLWSDGEDAALLSLLRDHSRAERDEFEGSGAQDRLPWASAIPFHNEDGEVIMLALRHMDYNEDTRRTLKRLLPATAWLDTQYPQIFLYCTLPRDKLVPLYDLPRLLAHPALPVIVCSTVELAEQNRRHPNCGFIWTAWLGGIDAVRHVDWEPLEGRDIFYLVNNHSGQTMAECCFEAERFALYFQQEQKDLAPKFVFVQVEYPEGDAPTFRDADEFVAYRERHQPNVETLGKIMSVSEILARAESLRQKATEVEDEAKLLAAGGFATPVPRNNGEAERGADDEKDEARFSDWLLRPLLIKGGITILHAPEESGKSSLALSVCGTLIADEPKDLVQGQWWLPPKDMRECGSVLYLDFDCEGESREIRDKVVDCLYPYLSNKPDKQEKALARFKAVPVEKELEFSGNWFKEHDPAEHDKSPSHTYVLNEIETFRKSQEPEHPLRLVVIDNWFAMVGDPEPTNAWKYTKPMLINIAKSGTSVLLVHHSNRSGATAGLTNKRRQIRMILKMEIPEGGKTEDRDLGDPIGLRVDKKNRAMPHPDKKGATIHIPRDGERWRIVGIPEDQVEDHALWRFGQTLEFIRSENQKSDRRGEKRMNNTEIANALGYGHQTFDRYRKAYEGGTEKGEKIEGRKEELDEKFGSREGE